MSTLITRLANTGTFFTNGIFDEVTNTVPGSLYFNGTSYLQSTSGRLIPLTQSTFTIEAWIYMTSNPIGGSVYYIPALIGDMYPDVNNNNWSFGPAMVGTNINLSFYWYPNTQKYVYGTTTNMNLNTWYHVAISVNSNAISLYVNGVSQTLTGTSTLTNRTASTNGFSIGTFDISQYNNQYTIFAGYATNIRLVNNTAVYTSNFTPPTTPLTAISNTALLLDVFSASKFITDSSSNNINLINNEVIYNSLSPLSSSTVVAESYSANGYFVSGILDEVTYNSTAPVIKNLLTYSQDFTQWGKNASPSDYTVVTNSIAAPDGKITADLIVKSTGAGTSSIVFKLFTGSINTTYCGSIYVKADGYSKVQVSFGNSAFNNTNIGANIDLTSGTINSILNSSTVVVQNVGNGWYRISVTATSGASGGNYVFGFQPLDNTYNTNFAGDGTSGIYVWGAQVELGSVATIYQGISASNTLVSPGFSKRIGNDGSSYVTNIFDEVTGIS